MTFMKESSMSCLYESSLRELASTWTGTNRVMLLGFPKVVKKVHPQKFEKKPWGVDPYIDK